MMQTSTNDLQKILTEIVVPQEHYAIQARRHLDTLTKPLGSLGRLEDLAAQWYSIRRGDVAGPLRKAVYVFAADHGIAAEGVSAYPAKVTQQMVHNFLAGGAAINVLARQHQADVHVIDVGVDAELAGHPGLLSYKVRRGSRNMLHEPAMTEAEMTAALDAGFSLSNIACKAGYHLIAVGEMGIANTTAASVMTAALTGAAATLITGRGTGVGDEAYAHKCSVVEKTIARHFAQPPTPWDILRCAGGLEIAAMTGMILGLARQGRGVVIDGFISTAAAAIACALAPATRSYLFAGHRSQEPGHRVLLAHLQLEPMLDLGMRLGEGTGAVLAMPLLEAAVRIFEEMATFAEAGVDEASE